MKLILGNNHSETFESFYQNVRGRSDDQLEYDAYRSLVFSFDTAAEQPIQVYSVATGKSLREYEAVYINNYINTYELAITVAICLDALGVRYANRELADAPSTSKLSEYARLAAAGVTIPRTIAATKHALLTDDATIASLGFPAVLKRANADRGIDNFTVHSTQEVRTLLEQHTDRSLWILQEFVAHEGYYRVAYNGGYAQYGVYRTLEPRPDGDPKKAHMYKPRGGANATLVERVDLPSEVLSLSDRAAVAMKREFAGVDCLYSRANGRAVIVEVNYNPQIVTLETFRETRIDAYIDGFKRL